MGLFKGVPFMKTLIAILFGVIALTIVQASPSVAQMNSMQEIELAKAKAEQQKQKEEAEAKKMKEANEKKQAEEAKKKEEEKKKTN